MKPIWLLVFVPLLFSVSTWVVSGGLPYFTDSNESFSAFVQGRNMLQFNPLANAFLTNDANAGHPQAHPFTYTHGPNLPRYFSAIMLLLGARGIEGQILIAAIICTVLSIWFIWEGFGKSADGARIRGDETVAALIIAFFCLDFLGVLQFITNLYRAWHFPLFWGCVWATRTRPRSPLAFIPFFLLFQMEFLFALFTAASCFGFTVLTNRLDWRAGFRSATAMVAGSAASAALFATQLIAFMGWKGFLFDLRTTYLARNTNLVEWQAIRQFYEARNIMMWPSLTKWDFPFPVFLKLTYETLNAKLGSILTTLAIVSIAVSVVLAVLPRLYRHSEPVALAGRANAALAPLLWSMILAYLFLGVTIPGYTLNGYTQRWAPLLVFPVIVALSLLIINVGTILRACVPTTFVHGWGASIAQRAAVLVAVPILVVWIAVSVEQYRRHPLFIHAPASALSSTYKGRSFVSYTTFPHMIAYYTSRWAYYSPPTFRPDERLDQSYNWNADRNKNPDYETPEYFLCERLPYYRNYDCDDIARQMVALGHTVAERGANFVVMRLVWEFPSASPAR